MVDPTHPRTDPPSTRVGVVDLGSNAIRLGIAEVGRSPPAVHEIESRRAAVRLGQAVLRTGELPDSVVAAVVAVLAEFRELCDVHGVTTVAAIATSAMRQAGNRADVLARIRTATGIDVRVVSGAEEAALAQDAVASRIELDRGSTLLVDVGGGSVELRVLRERVVARSESWPIGTLRILEDLGPELGIAGGPALVERLGARLAELSAHVRATARPVDRYIATGGNIDAIADVLTDHGTRPHVAGGIERCRLEDLDALAHRLADLTTEQRMTTFALRPDRADTILPAVAIYQCIGAAADCSEVMVPRVGLRDGLFWRIAHGQPVHTDAAEGDGP